MSARDFGPDYPRFLGSGRNRKPLVRELRWSRWFGNATSKIHVSRFEDGSARITYDEVVNGWPSWSAGDRSDFCLNCIWLRGHPDLPDILRFVAAHGEEDEWLGIALPLAHTLPAAEAFAALEKMFLTTEIGTRGNLVQALGCVDHPRSVELVVAAIRALVPLAATWRPGPHVNGHASELGCAVKAALHLGADAVEYTDLVRRLASHPCAPAAAVARSTLVRDFPEMLGPKELPPDSILPTNVVRFVPRRR